MGDTTNITLYVDDGTCVSKANTYVSLAEADSYMVDTGRTAWAAMTEEARKSCLINATRYIDHVYAKYGWYGRRKYESQPLAFPRVELVDADGFNIDGQIPGVLKQAVCEAAFISTTKSLFATNDTNGVVKRVKVSEIEKEYFENNSDSSEVDYISQYAILDSLLAGLYRTKYSNSNVHHVAWHDLAGGTIGGW